MSGGPEDLSGPWSLVARVRRWRAIGPVVGLVLLAAAVTVLVRSGTTLEHAWRSLQAASPVLLCWLAASMLGSVFLTGCVFWVLTRRFAAIPFGQMQALMAATTLANYLPLRPGLVGRIVFHRTRHGIRARDSLLTVVEAVVMSLLSLGILVPALGFGPRLGVSFTVSLSAPAALGAACLLWRPGRPWALAWLLRYAETLLTAWRYHIAFALVGTPVPAETSVGIACVSMAATLVPIVSNGIGLREWAIGLLAPVLAGYSLEQGIAAELVNRAAEVAIVVPTGLLGALALWRRDRDQRAEAEELR